jgi:sulfur carrier protein
MQITLNGATHQLEEGQSVAELLEQLQLVGKRLAVEVNEEIIPKSRHTIQQLQSGDRVEIVHAIGGG